MRMMNIDTKKQMKEIKTRIVDFFWVYFDEKTAKNIDRHPENAIVVIRTAIIDGLPTKERLSIYASALSDAVLYQGLVSINSKR